ncbi:MAG: hypothetical protein M1449_01280 [Candidatus Thermoplasmatota archaeon]|nr:hypothetical protein [Candidatus Thermoplasmatota archaeon]
MSSLTSLEKRRFEDLFGMASGYVLDFTDRTFSQFFRENGGINIYGGRYSYNGESKAKHLRAFWEKDVDVVVGRVLKAMLELWRYQNESGKDGRADKTYSECLKTAARLMGKEVVAEETEEEFLKKDFGAISVVGLDIDPTIAPILESRIREAMDCHHAGASLASIFMCGSVLEGILLNIALKNPAAFNQAKSSPKSKETEKVRPFQDWTLANLIDVAHEVGLLRLDVKKFSHVMRDFRNYIHPYEQMASRFDPDKHTAEICLQVLRAALVGLKGK